MSKYHTTDRPLIWYSIWSLTMILTIIQIRMTLLSKRQKCYMDLFTRVIFSPTEESPKCLKNISRVILVTVHESTAKIIQCSQLACQICLVRQWWSYIVQSVKKFTIRNRADIIIPTGPTLELVSRTCYLWYTPNTDQNGPHHSLSPDSMGSKFTQWHISYSSKRHRISTKRQKWLLATDFACSLLYHAYTDETPKLTNPRKFRKIAE